MVVVPLAFGSVPLSLMAAVFLLIQLQLLWLPTIVVAEKLVLHDVQVAQQQFHLEQLQELQQQQQRSSSLPSSSTTQLLSATIKTQLYRVSSSIKPYQRTLLANALHNFFEHVFDDARQDVYKLDITHVAIYEEKLLMKATTSDGANRKLVLNSLQSSQFHIQQSRSGGGAEEEVGDDDDDDEIEEGFDAYDDEDGDNNDDESETDELMISTQTDESESERGSSNVYVLSFATFVSAQDSTQPVSSLSQDGEFQSMLIHVCRKFSSHLLEFVQSIDDDYFAHVTNALVSDFEDDELREKEIEENEMMTLKSSMISSSSGSRLSVASIAAIILGIVALTLAAIKVRR